MMITPLPLPVALPVPTMSAKPSRVKKFSFSPRTAWGYVTFWVVRAAFDEIRPILIDGEMVLISAIEEAFSDRRGYYFDVTGVAVPADQTIEAL